MSAYLFADTRSRGALFKSSLTDFGLMGERIAGSKLVLLGESAVGKSSIVLQFVKSQFNEYQEATIGAAFFTQVIVCEETQRPIKFEIWDTAGQERYHSLAPMYYRGAQAAIVVYDITNSLSFQQAKNWVTELKAQAEKVKVITLAGNKCDLESQRAVTQEEAKAYAEDQGLQFMETSAKTCTNITELFKKIASKLSQDVPAPSVGQQLQGSDSTAPASHCCR